MNSTVQRDSISRLVNYRKIFHFRRAQCDQRRTMFVVLSTFFSPVESFRQTVERILPLSTEMELGHSCCRLFNLFHRRSIDFRFSNCFRCSTKRISRRRIVEHCSRSIYDERCSLSIRSNCIDCHNTIRLSKNNHAGWSNHFSIVICNFVCEPFKNSLYHHGNMLCFW